MIEELQTRHGIMFVPTADQCQYEWMAHSGASPEDPDIETVTTILAERPRGIIFDVGANFGAWTVPLAKYATLLWAFEPQRCCAELLSKSVRANSISNAFVKVRAVGEDFGHIMVPQLDINTSSNFGGVSLIGKNLQQPDAPLERVGVVCLDAYSKVGSVTFIKIDVEGGEIGVLRGATTIIERDRPVLFLEYNHVNGDPDLIRKFLDDADYGYMETSIGNYLCMPL